MVKLGANYLQEAKRHRRIALCLIRDAICIEDEDHQPRLLRIVSLPTTGVARTLDLDAFVGMQDRISGVPALWQQIGMPIVVLVLRDRGAVLRQRRRHEFPDDAAEVGGHQEAFEPRQFAPVELGVDELQEAEELIHRVADVLDGATVWYLGIGVEVLDADPCQRTCPQFGIRVIHTERVAFADSACYVGDPS